jgi:hypothetical protein
MISDLDIWRAANLLIRQHGDDAELAAARRADLSNAAISTGKPSGNGSDEPSLSCKPRRPGRRIDPWDDLAIPRMHRIVRPTPVHFGC